MDLKKSNLYGYLANQCVMGQDYDCAIAFYKDAIELFQLDYRYFVNRSFCYDRLNQFAEALEDADRAIKLHPIGPNCHFRKGRALKGLKHFERAQESFEKVIELVGQNCPEAHYELIQIRKATNNEKGETDDDNKEYQQIVTLSEAQETLSDQIWLEKSHSLATEQNDLPKMVQTQTKAVATGQPLGLICDILTRFSLNDPHLENGYIQQPQNQSVFSDQHQIGDKEFQLIAKSMTIRPQNNKHYHHHHHHHRQRFNGDECYYWRTTGCIFPENCKKLHIPANKGIEYQPWMNQRRRKISSSSNRSSNNRDGNNDNHNNGNHNYTNSNTNSNANNINGSNSTDNNSNGNNNNQGNTSRRRNNNNENRFHRNTFHRKPKSKNNLRNNHNSNKSNSHNPNSNFNSNNLFCNYNSSNSNNYDSNSNSNSNYDSNSSISNNTNNSK